MVSHGHVQFLFYGKKNSQMQLLVLNCFLNTEETEFDIYNKFESALIL